MAERNTGRNRPVLAILGDGAANHSIQAFCVAARHRLPVVLLVLNNGEHGILKASADRKGTPGVPGMDLPGLDLVTLATGCGCTGSRVATKEALAEALRDA